jgi:glycosyltransferase involved in cell wall biosynthesis
MVGRNRGHITQQGQVLCDLFAGIGYRVTSVSAFPNRYLRLGDIVATLVSQRKQTDILILEVYGGPSFVLEDIASRLGQRFGQRLVLWLHGGALPEFMSRFPEWTRRVLVRADVVVTPSDFLARAVSRYGIEARVIPNVIDFEAYPFRHRKFVKPHLFWMRQFHPIWNPMMALRVLDRLRSSLPDSSLVMAGSNKGLQAAVEEMARDLKLSDRVRFPGFLDMAGKTREGSSADIYLNTNRIDNTPIAVVEACAMGLPVVTTAVGGIRDFLIDRETALIVPDNDDAAMAAAIEELVRNQHLAAHLSANGRRLAKRFSWEFVRPPWERLFAELMGESSETAPSSLSRTLAGSTGSLANAAGGPMAKAS